MASEPQFVGEGERLPPTAVVVRWGISPLDKVKQAAENDYARRLDEGLPGEYAISGEYRLGCTAREIALRTLAKNCRQYKQMRATTAGALADAGFEAVQEGRLGHVSIKLGGEPTDDRLNAVCETLADPEPNPAWGGP